MALPALGSSLSNRYFKWAGTFVRSPGASFIAVVDSQDKLSFALDIFTDCIRLRKLKRGFNPFFCLSLKEYYWILVSYT